MNITYFNLSLAGYLLAAIFYTGRLIAKKQRSVFADIFMALGVIFNTLFIIARWVKGGQPPFGNIFESLVLFTWSLALIYLFIELKYRPRLIAPFCAVAAVLILAYSSILDTSIRPLIPALQSNWLTVHVITCMLSYGAFAIAFIIGIIYIILYKGSRMKSGDTLERLDALIYKTIALGFFALTLGIVTGSVWANRAWGSYWSWDPKETWALITWFVYAIYLHLKLVRRWRGAGLAWLAILGFLVVLFTYFGVSFLMKGLHSYA